MLRIPVYDQAQVRSQPLPGVRVHSTGPTGLEQLGQGISQAAQLADRVYSQAAAAASADAETQYEAEITADFRDDQKGLFNLNPDEAFAQEQPAFDALNAKRERIAKDIKDERARGMFLARAAKMDQQLRNETESKFAHKRRQKLQESSEARKAAGLSAIAKGAWADDEGVETQAQLIGTAAAALALTAEGRAAAMADARGQAYEVAVEARIANNDWAGAQQMMIAHADDLGQRGVVLRKKYEGYLHAATAQVATSKLLDGSRDPETKWANENKARADFEALPDGPMKEEVRKRLEERLAVEDRKKDADIKDRFKRALGAYNRGGLGAVDPGDRMWLNKYAPEYEARLLNDHEQKIRQRRGDGAEMRREQAERNRVVLQDFMSRPPEERAKLDIEAVYGATGADDVGMGEVRVRQRNSIEGLKGDLVGKEARFVQDAKSQAAGIVTNKSKQKVFEAEARILFEDFVRTNGKAPTDEQAYTLQKSLLDKTIVEKGFIFDTKGLEFERRALERKQQSESAQPRPAAPATAPAATPKKPPAIPRRERILQLKKAGKSAAEITQALNQEGY